MTTLRVRPDQAPAVAFGERALAALFLSLMLARLPGLSLVPVAVVPGLMIAVVTLSTGPRQVRHLALWAAAAVASGFIALARSVGVGGPTPTPVVAGSVIIWVAAIPLTVALAAWSFRRISHRTGLLLALAGGIASEILRQGTENWKGTLGIFVTAFVLVWLARRPVLATLALAGLTLASVANDARSMAVIGIVSLVVTHIMRPGKRTKSTLRRGIRVVAAIAVTAAFGLWLMTSGLLGPDIQQRTQNQLAKPALITGARVEWAATLSLFADRPMGFGIGARPNDAQISDAISAVQLAGGDYLSSYFPLVVFGERVDLHSAVANLWFHFGIGGLVLAAVVGRILLAGVRDPASSVFGIAAVYLPLIAFWDLLFSPMANVDRIIVGLTVATLAAGVTSQGGRAVERPSASRTARSKPRYGGPSTAARRRRDLG